MTIIPYLALDSSKSIINSKWENWHLKLSSAAPMGKLTETEQDNFVHTYQMLSKRCKCKAIYALHACNKSLRKNVENVSELKITESTFSLCSILKRGSLGRASWEAVSCTITLVLAELKGPGSHFNVRAPRLGWAGIMKQC